MTPTELEVPVLFLFVMGRIIGRITTLTSFQPGQSSKRIILIPLLIRFLQFLTALMHLKYIFSYFPHLQSQEQQEFLQERIRWQLEHCDTISGVVLLEDHSRGWSCSPFVSDYLTEEGVPSLFTLGLSELPSSKISERRRCEQQFNETLGMIQALQHSTMTSRSNTCPVLSACCLDSFLTPYGFIISFHFISFQIQSPQHPPSHR